MTPVSSRKKDLAPWSIRLRTMFVIVGICAILICAAREWRIRALDQQRVVSELLKLGWYIEYPRQTSMINRYVSNSSVRDYFFSPHKVHIGNDHLVTQDEIDLVSNLIYLKEVGVVPWKSAATPVSFVPLAKLQHLRRLLISGHSVMDSDVVALGKCSQLKFLGITNGNMTRSAIGQVAKMKNVEFVEFGYIGLPQESIETEFLQSPKIKLTFAFEDYRLRAEQQ